MDADFIKDAVSRYWAQKCYAVASEIGLTNWGTLRADIMAVSTKLDFVIVEVKSSYADFRSDKKWWHYLNHCNRMYFAVSEPVYEKVHDLIPKGIGIFVVGEHGDVRVRKPAKKDLLDAATVQKLLVKMVFRKSDTSRFGKRK
jgi:hypothetical protein